MRRKAVLSAAGAAFAKGRHLVFGGLNMNGAELPEERHELKVCAYLYNRTNPEMVRQPAVLGSMACVFIESVSLGGGLLPHQHFPDNRHPKGAHV